ncbi:hypothetical protein PYCC9005_005428 [Savitreella phatthalungensis]
MLFHAVLLLGLALEHVSATPADDIVAAGRDCRRVGSIVSSLGTASVSSARAFCNNYVGAKSIASSMVTASAVTSTVTQACGASPSRALVKRATSGSGFVRQPAALCPQFMTAIGTAGLSTACSCLTGSATTTTTSVATFTPTSTVTKYIQGTSTVTSTSTVTAPVRIVNSTIDVVSTRTTTIIDSTTIVSTSFTQGTDVTTTVTITPSHTLTILDMSHAVTVYSSVTVTGANAGAGAGTSVATGSKLAKRAASTNAVATAASGSDACKPVLSTTVVVVTVSPVSTATIYRSSVAVKSTNSIAMGSASITQLTRYPTLTSTVTDSARIKTVKVTPTMTAYNYLLNGKLDGTPGEVPDDWDWENRADTFVSPQPVISPGRGVDGSNAVLLTYRTDIYQTLHDLPPRMKISGYHSGFGAQCPVEIAAYNGPSFYWYASTGYVNTPTPAGKFGPFEIDNVTSTTTFYFSNACGTAANPVYLSQLFVGQM